MAENFKGLRDSGTLGTWAANILVILTTQWPPVLSAVIAIVVAAYHGTREFFLSPPVLTAMAVWLLLWWTYLGFRLLAFQRVPRMVQNHQDYRYGLTIEGFLPVFIAENSPIISQRGTMGLMAQIRNYSPGPIRYSLESAEVQIGTRAIPKYPRNKVRGYMARGGGKSAAPDAFPTGSLVEFYGKGETKGTAEYVFVYGAPDGPMLRRFTLSLELTFFFPENGMANLATGENLGFSLNIISEEDCPF